jgi:hypothetical protein
VLNLKAAESVLWLNYIHTVTYSVRVYCGDDKLGNVLTNALTDQKIYKCEVHTLQSNLEQNEVNHIVVLRVTTSCILVGKCQISWNIPPKFPKQCPILRSMFLQIIGRLCVHIL